MIGYIYVIRSKNPNDMSQNFYIGSAKDIKNRGIKHKCSCNNIEDPHCMLRVYQFIRSNGGWDNFIMYSLHEVECKDKLELRQYEQKYIDFYNPGLNERNAIIDLEARRIKQYAKQNMKTICECGGKYTHINKLRHLGTKKHIRYALSI
jgi:hypothetical protein